MKIIIDADASPVKNEVIKVAGKFNLKVLLIMSIAHHSDIQLPDHVERIYVEKGMDQADFKIIQLAKTGDVIVTQDYGLASLLLAKNCRVVHHMAYEYTDENINRLLEQRHFNSSKRKSGKKTKGPSAFTEKNRKEFEYYFKDLIQKLES
ncbi:MAG: YaiI/YqxD family protein [Atopostipes sp.]|nr:YaiI/YqxD family protein [Atopostipes sp.]